MVPQTRSDATWNLICRLFNYMRRHFWCLIAIAAVYLTIRPAAVRPDDESRPWIEPGARGALRYVSDVDGNTIPDFSNCGYQGGDVPLPEVPTVVVLEPAPGDDTQRIQQALNGVSP